MKKFFIITLLFIFNLPCLSDVIKGSIEKKSTKIQHRLIDAKTKQPVTFALIRIPTIGYETKTDENGVFKLNADITAPMILSVQKSGYKPFSITINEDNINAPIIIGIEKNQLTSISISTDVIHLGDNKFSKNSANSMDFKLQSSGPYLKKTFTLTQPDINENAYLVIGSVIGLDTLFARQMKQSKVTTAYSTPAEIYFNGQKIAEVKYNGDGQQILLPKSLIRANSNNEITVKTGRNLFQSAYIDYDDIEIANLYIEFKPILANENR